MDKLNISESKINSKNTSDILTIFFFFFKGFTFAGTVKFSVTNDLRIATTCL